MFRIKPKEQDATTTPKTQKEEGVKEMKKNNENATTMSKKEETKMKKATAAAKKSIAANTNKREENATMKKATETNALTLNGVTITLSPEQSAAIAAMLMGGTTTASAPVQEAPAPAPKKRTTKKTATKTEEAEKRELSDFTEFKVRYEGGYSFVNKDGGFLYQKAIRQALNVRLKLLCDEMGITPKYNKSIWAWEVTTSAGKKPTKTVLNALGKALSAPVTVAEQRAVYNAWEDIKAKRAAK